MNGANSLSHVSSQAQLVDLFTKAIRGQEFIKFFIQVRRTTKKPALQALLGITWLSLSIYEMVRVMVNVYK